MTQMTAPVRPTNGQSNIVIRAFEPLAPVGSAGGLKGLLETQAAGIRNALPKHVTPERLIKTMLVAANRNPDILKCTQSSIVECINRAAELGLDLSGTLGEAYPVPFNNNISQGDGTYRQLKQCTLIIGYRGLEKLAWQSGEIDSIDAEVVFQHDQFVFKKGTTVLVEWSPKLDGDRGQPIGAYACVSMKSGGKLARFLTMKDLKKIRNSSKSKDSPAWKNWEEEMWRKSALKRTLKDAPLSTEKFVAAMEHESSDLDLTDVLDVERDKQGSAAALNKRLQAEPPIIDSQIVDQDSGELIDENPVTPAADEDQSTTAPAGDEPQDQMTHWEQLMIRLDELAAARGADAAQVRGAAVKCLPKPMAKNPAGASAAECDKILKTANEGAGFFAMLKPAQ